MHEALSASIEPAWIPTDDVRRRAQLTRFLAATGHPDFDSLYRYSIEDIPGFTSDLLRFLDIVFDTPPRQVMDTSRGIEWTRWCVGARMNISISCVDRHVAGGRGNSPAIVWESEEGSSKTLTYAMLLAQVNACAGGLRRHGIGPGDAVAIHLPMMPETVVALLAIARIGAVTMPLFSGYGPSAIESRINDIGAKLIFTCDGFPRRGAPVRAKKVVDEALQRCPSVKTVVVVPRMHNEVELAAGRDVRWNEFLETPGAEAGILEAEHPLMVIYTSGTTGKPKGIVHSHCGFPVKAAQDMCFGTDAGTGTRISWITDLGWVMGPWLIYGGLILGATLVLYDGAPDFPDCGRLWAFCERNRVEVLGISPSLIRALVPHGDRPVQKYDLSSLRILASTGEPWNPDPWWWLFEVVGRRRLPIINYSGGTEISGGILMGNPLLPLKPCSFPAPCPGIAADVVNEGGEPVRGQVGELVIRKPWIGMARGFVNDPDRYLATYWSRWPGVWVHGDWAMVDDDGHWYILGRSDDTLKIAGKRVGPAEVESILVGHPAVMEAAVIGVPDELKGNSMVAFCVPMAGSVASDQLKSELKDLVGNELGKPLRPSRICFVTALPRTRNAKVMRRVIRAAYMNEDAGDLSALENPAAVELIRAARDV